MRNYEFSEKVKVRLENNMGMKEFTLFKSNSYTTLVYDGGYDIQISQPFNRENELKERLKTPFKFSEIIFIRLEDLEKLVEMLKVRRVVEKI